MELILKNKLFTKAREIVASRQLRCELSDLRRELMIVTNSAWDEAWNSIGAPDWYERVLKVKDRLIRIIENHLMRVDDIPEFLMNGWGKTRAGDVPYYLKEWDAAWETTVSAQIDELELNLPV